MTNMSLQSQVRRLRANIQANYAEMRAELHQTLHEGQTRRLQAERARRAAAHQAADHRRAELRQLQEDVRVKLEIDMEMLHMTVESFRQERLAQRRRTAWHGRTAISSQPHMPVATAEAIALTPAAAPHMSTSSEAHHLSEELTEAAQSDARKAQARRKSAKSSADAPDAATTGAGE